MFDKRRRGHPPTQSGQKKLILLVADGKKMLVAIIIATILVLACPVSAGRTGPGFVTKDGGGMDGEKYKEYIDWLKELYKDGGEYTESHFGYDFFDMFNTTSDCLKLERLPAVGLDGSWVCLERIIPLKCIVYSIRPGKQYDFETEMALKGCEVHSFDCNNDSEQDPPIPGLTTHKWCLSGVNAPDYNYYTIETLMSKLGHKRLDYLKLDVSEEEFFAIPSLENIPPGQLPLQLQFKLYVPPWYFRYERTAASMRATIELMLTLDRLGYRLVARENSSSPCCVELLYIRPSIRYDENGNIIQPQYYSL